MASELPRTIVGLLAGYPQGATVDDLYAQLYPGPPADLAVAVKQRANIITALTILKAEHRAWPTGDRWKITSRGRDT